MSIRQIVKGDPEWAASPIVVEGERSGNIARAKLSPMLFFRSHRKQFDDLGKYGVYNGVVGKLTRTNFVQ